MTQSITMSLFINLMHSCTCMIIDMFRNAYKDIHM